MDLQNFREQLSQIDEKLLNLLEERTNLSQKIGELKAQNGVKIEDQNKEQQKLRVLKQLAESKNLHPSFIEKLWQLIFDESKRIQSQ